jgi:hypothetical protein
MDGEFSRRCPVMLRAALAVFVLATSVLTPLPASAGGNWIEIRKGESVNAYLVPGSKRVAHATAYAEDPLKVRERGPYFAWLSPVTYGWTLPRVDSPQTVRLGRLSIDWDRMKASVSFIVPQMPPGEYVIAFCDSDCSHTFGDVDPTGEVQVFATSLGARLTKRLDKVDASVEMGRYAARHANRRLGRRLNREIDDVGAEVSNLHDRLSSLSTAVDGIRRAARPQVPSWGLVAAALLAAAAGFGLGRANVRYTRRRAIDRELDELVGRR